MQLLGFRFEIHLPVHDNLCRRTFDPKIIGKCHATRNFHIPGNIVKPETLTEYIVEIQSDSSW